MIWTCYGFNKSWNMIRHFLRVGSMFLTFKNSPNHKLPSQTHIENHEKANEPIEIQKNTKEPNRNIK